MRDTRQTRQEITPEQLASLAEHSIEVILTHQAPNGAYEASPNFSVYHYSWLRDGAFIADAMSRAGYTDSASAFYDWCREVIGARADRIEELIRRSESGETIDIAEFLHPRFTIDGEDSGDDWTNHQLDGYGAWLWGLDQHLTRTPGASIDDFTLAVEATVRYLIAFWRVPCYDCWEESADYVHVATLAAVAAGLRVAASWPSIPTGVRVAAKSAVAEIEVVVRERGVRDGHLVKWLDGYDVDASLLFCAIPYRLFAPDDPLMESTVGELSDQLVHEGMHRHVNDTYFGGGEWLLLTAIHGSYLAAIGDRDGARSRLQYVASQAAEDGSLPEQVSTHLLHPEYLDEWQKRWGAVASPLLWSHAMYLNLYRELHTPQ